MLDGSVDLEQTTDSDDTMTGASEHASNQPDTPDLKGSENTEVSEDIDGDTGVNKPFHISICFNRCNIQKLTGVHLPIIT